jgi:histidinol-phosphate aminotransferase
MSEKYTNDFRDKIDIHSNYDYSLLDWNESPSPSVPSVNDFISNRIKLLKLNLYPNVSKKGLVEKLQLFNETNKKILLYNGSDSFLKDLCMTFLSPGDTISVIGPTYTQIDPFISAMGSKKNLIVPDNIFEPKITEMSHKMTNSKVVYLSNPNNPTGVLYSNKDILKLASLFPETIFVVDEAYIEFSKNDSIIRENISDNIIVSRSFSKAFGFAGIRLGYIMTSDKCYYELEKINNPKSINTIAQEVGRFALSNINEVYGHVKEVVHNRDRLYNTLRDLGFDVYNSFGNFILLKIKNNIELVNYCESKGIILRDRSSFPKMEGFIRISIGSKSQIDDLVKILLEFQQ